MTQLGAHSHATKACEQTPALGDGVGLGSGTLEIVEDGRSRTHPGPASSEAMHRPDHETCPRRVVINHDLSLTSGPQNTMDLINGSRCVGRVVKYSPRIHQLKGIVGER